MTYMNTAQGKIAESLYDFEAQEVARWARQITDNYPEMTHGEAIRIAEKWMKEKREKGNADQIHH